MTGTEAGVLVPFRPLFYTSHQTASAKKYDQCLRSVELSGTASITGTEIKGAKVGDSYKLLAFLATATATLTSKSSVKYLGMIAGRSKGFTADD